MVAGQVPKRVFSESPSRLRGLPPRLGPDGLRSTGCSSSCRRRKERRKMEAAPAPQRCCTTWGHAGQATLVRTGNFTPPESLAAGPGTCKPWMQSKGADVSKCRAHSIQRAPQTRSQTQTSDLAVIRRLRGAGASAARPQTQWGEEPTFRASLGQHRAWRRGRQLPAGREKATACVPGPQR